MQSELPVRLLLRDNASGANLTEPLDGYVNDVSLHGVRLTVAHIRVDRFHLFYSFNDNPSHSLHLEIKGQDQLPLITVPIRPVWFDHILSEPSKPFQLGMEFLLEPEDAKLQALKELLTQKHKEQPSWWQRFFT